jgi:transcriptional regulator with XRE-family HTH domain
MKGGTGSSDWAGVVERLNLAFKQTDWSISELARRAGSSQPAISEYLAGTQVPGAAVLLRIADELKISLDWLMRDEGPAERRGGSADDRFRRGGLMALAQAQRELDEVTKIWRGERRQPARSERAQDAAKLADETAHHFEGPRQKREQRKRRKG